MNDRLYYKLVETIAKKELLFLALYCTTVQKFYWQKNPLCVTNPLAVCVKLDVRKCGVYDPKSTVAFSPSIIRLKQKQVSLQLIHVFVICIYCDYDDDLLLKLLRIKVGKICK